MKNKKLLLLGGTRNMKEILDKAHAMGVKVGITDWYDTSRSPIKLLADEHFNVSITDGKAMDELIRAHGYDGVLTGYTDSYLETYAGICRRNGLSCYGTEEQFRILTDKSRYKKLFREFGVPALDSLTREALLGGFDDYPVLLKPSGGSGGKGLKILENRQDLTAFMQGKEDTVLDDYVIEPYIRDRQELTAFFLFVDGEIHLTGTADRFLSGPQGDRIGLPVLYSLPSSVDKDFRKITAPPLIRLFRSLGLKDGMLFAQCIMNQGRALVYDLGYRLTGTLEYKLLDRIYGFDPLEMMIRHALTGSMLEPGQPRDIEALLKRPGFGFNATILARPGTIGSIEGEEAILRMPGVIDVAFKAVAGETIPPSAVGTLGQIVARIFFAAETLDEAGRILDGIYDKIRIRDTEGQDMILALMDSETLTATYQVGQTTHV